MHMQRLRLRGLRPAAERQSAGRDRGIPGIDTPLGGLGRGPHRDTGHTGLAMTEFMGGRAEAVHDMETILESARSLDDPYSIAFLALSRGQSYTHLGDLGRAERYLNAALDYYRRN